MNKAEYLSVLVSIVIGMGLSHLLSSAGRLIIARARVRVYWVSLMAAAVIFLAHIQFWWSTYGYDEAILGNFFSFLVFLLAPILLYLMAVLVFPDFDDDLATVSMYDHYYSVRPWAFGVGAAAVLANVVRNVAVQNAPLLTEDRPFEAGFLVLMLSGALVRSPRYHAALNVALLAAFCAMVVFTSLQPG
ncbi:MAG: hypothetical protein AVDCRST_MAG68-20 [uncultured Gemmatimonadetes bacterium]|uniref:Uncharacterized protein n=1 Tax=uncultured Gemmatimonadota bacterium TaxID=203437 RepID=A0A6J4K533_9BACT|nr:MAG: hypothetical protein AVDCRST_MAG68-20 [uncultured Gemmatimonadota bacterium]